MTEQQRPNQEPQSSNEMPPMSRSQYRQQLNRRPNLQSATGSRSDQKADNHDQFSEPLSRESTANERKETAVAEKTMRLKHRLNIAIVALVVAIIIVYLILFLVK